MRLRIAGVLGVVAALMIGAAVPASAAGKKFTDAKGDVTTGNGGVGKAPDITAVRVNYGGARAKVVVRFKKLTQKNITNVNFYFDTDRDGFDDAGINVLLTKGEISYRISGRWSVTVDEDDEHPVTVSRDLGKGGTVSVIYPTYYLGSEDDPPPSLGVVVAAHRLSKDSRSLGSDWAPKGSSMHGKNKWMRVGIG